MKWMTIVLFAMLVGVGCDKKEDAAPAAGTKTEKAAEGPKDVSKAATTPAEVDEDIPTTADFEDEATKEIDNASVEAEVDKLAKEIGE